MTDLPKIKRLALVAQRFRDEVTPKTVLDLFEQIDAMPDQDEVDSMLIAMRPTVTPDGRAIFERLVRLVGSEGVCHLLEENWTPLGYNCPDCGVQVGVMCTGDNFCANRTTLAAETEIEAEGIPKEYACHLLHCADPTCKTHRGQR